MVAANVVVCYSFLLKARVASEFGLTIDTVVGDTISIRGPRSRDWPPTTPLPTPMPLAPASGGSDCLGPRETETTRYRAGAGRRGNLNTYGDAARPPSMETEHAVPVSGGEVVSAIHHEADAGDGAIVFCHGFRSDMTGSYEGRCLAAIERGYDAVRFDFRGCGDSDGTFAEATLSARIADLEAVLDYFDPDPVVLFGSSFGGKVAFHRAVGDDRVEAVATRAPVTYGAFDDLGATVEAEGEVRFDDGRRIDARFIDDLERHDFDEVEAGLDCPTAIFHGADDESVGVEDSFRAAENLDADVLLQTYVGEGHRFSREAEARMREQLFDWLSTARAGP